jgi:hypothetical protein
MLFKEEEAGVTENEEPLHIAVAKDSVIVAFGFITIVYKNVAPAQAEPPAIVAVAEYTILISELVVFVKV